MKDGELFCICVYSLVSVISAAQGCYDHSQKIRDSMTTKLNSADVPG